MEELKAEATKLGLDFKGNISRKDLEALIEDAKNQIANGSEVKDESEPKPTKAKENEKIKVIVTPRDSEEKEGFVGLNGYRAQYKFDEEIELPANIVEFLKSKGGYITSPKGEKKWVSRYLVEVL